MYFKNKKYYQDKLLQSFPKISLIFDEKQHVLIFGAARLGKILLTNLKKNGVNVVAFVDNDKKLHKTTIEGVKIISLKETKNKYLNSPIIIASVLYQNEIYKLLKKAKFKNIYPIYYLNLVRPDIFTVPEMDNMFDVVFAKKNQHEIEKVHRLLKDFKSKKVFDDLIKYRITAKHKYIDMAKSKHFLFDEKNIFPLTNKEVFIDCGAYDGDSIRQFAKVVYWKFDKIFAFEPDYSNFLRLKKWINSTGLTTIYAYKKGVYSKTGIINFNSGGKVDSKIPDNSQVYSNIIRSKKNIEKSNYISVVSLDDFFKNKKTPTLIKMDIEGSEILALNGVRKIIKKYKPKLAISIYHKPTDLWKIILLLNSINNNYKFYIRHYTGELADTICYGV